MNSKLCARSFLSVAPCCTVLALVIYKMKCYCVHNSSPSEYIQQREGTNYTFSTISWPCLLLKSATAALIASSASIEQCSFTGGSLRCAAMSVFLMDRHSSMFLPVIHSVTNDDDATQMIHTRTKAKLSSERDRRTRVIRNVLCTRNQLLISLFKAFTSHQLRYRNRRF